MSLDKDASSDPNLKAVHAGASMRKAQHLQPKAPDIADAEVVVLPFPDSLPTFEYSPSRGKSPLCKTIIFALAELNGEFACFRPLGLLAEVLCLYSRHTLEGAWREPA